MVRRGGAPHPVRERMIPIQEDHVSTTDDTIETTAPRRLVRRRDDRWLAGVSAGLGDYFDVPPLVYRIAFLALVFAGGTGLLLYAAAWLIIPEEGEPDSIAVRALRDHRERPWLTVGVGLLAFAALALLADARPWGGDGDGWLIVALVGAGLVWYQSRRERRAALAAAAASGEAVPPRRHRIARVIGWTAGIVALVAALVLVAALAFGISALGGVGERSERPVSAVDVDRRYELAVGDLTVDLADVPLAPGTTAVDVRVGVGDLTIEVPEGVDVDLTGAAGLGAVDVLGVHSDGTDVRRHVVDDSAPGNRTLEVDAVVGVGDLEIVRG
jgi:phage shock protein PspC (stress-responsive transcriptional regulator)